VRRRLAVALAAAGLALAAAGCAAEGDAAGASFEPAHPGVLAVATALVPAPGFWEGPPTDGGFEAQLATALAHRLGLDRVRVVQVPFGQIVSGHLGGADLAMSQLTPSSEREHSLDFSTPYLTSPPGVLAREGVEAPDLKSLQALRWVTSRTSTLTPIVLRQVRPDTPPISVEDRSAALAVLRSGRADALLLDLPVALGLARDDPGQFTVLGQLPGTEGLAAALPDGSANLEIVDTELRALQADGTIDRLRARWLGSEDAVPLIRTEG
jgi:polar amino acid transport system substrate-binding protein